MQPVKMNFSYGESFMDEAREAYERLLHDAMLGDHTLFARGDSVERAWEVVQPILDNPPPICSTRPGAGGRTRPRR